MVTVGYMTMDDEAQELREALPDDQKTALVTGGSQGIGRAIAHRLVRRGLQVIVTGRSAESLADAQSVLGQRAMTVRSDAGDVAAIAQLSVVISQSVGSLDVLVLNAGHPFHAEFGTMTEDDYDRAHAVNAKGPYFAAQILGPLIRDGGAIVVTTSLGSTMGRRGLGAYDSSKAALRAMTRNLASEFLPRGIRVNAVKPGYIDSGVLERSELPAEATRAAHQAMRAATPMGRPGTPEEVASAVEFLAFDATFTTGAELSLDGGWGELAS